MTKKTTPRKAGIWIPISLAILFFSLSSSSHSYSENLEEQVERPFSVSETDLQEQAYSILKLKCNTCHKKRNPFMVFNMKNMERRAEKIKKQVFELKRMPLEGTTLTPEEYSTLKNWLDAI